MIRRLSLVLLIFLGLAVIYTSIPESPLPANTPIDSLVVHKNKNTLEAYSQNTLIKTYKISLGGNPSGHKQSEGDKRTPEGLYFIDGKNPGSTYHKNLGISYPNSKDIADAKRNGLDPGGDIKIHGIRNGLGFIGKFQRFFNWTAGCLAVTNNEIDELYANVKVGTPIYILP